MDKTQILQTLKIELAEKQKKLKMEEMNKFGLGKMNVLIENNLDQAKLLIATQDVIEKLQKIASRLAELNADEIMPLADSMKAAFGPEVASQFEHVASQSILAAQDAVRAAKDAIDNAVLKVEGKMVTSDDTDMAQYREPVETKPQPTQDKEDTILSDMSTEPPLGREVKDSIQYKKSTLTESSKSLRRARAIASIIETNIDKTGKANTSVIVSKFIGSKINEEEGQEVLEKFVEEYGCTPALYSAKLKRLKENLPTTGDNADTPPAGAMDKTEQAQSQAVNQIASQVASNPGVLNQPISSVASTLPPEQKNAVNDTISNDQDINASTTVKDYLQKQSNGNKT